MKSRLLARVGAVWIQRRRKTRCKVNRLKNKLSGREYVHVLHVTKTGGNAVRYALRDHLVTARYTILLCPSGRVLKDIPKGDKVCFFLREPASRFVSGFYSRKRQGRPRIYSPWSAEEERAFGIFDVPNTLAEALYDPCETLRKEARDAMAAIGHVRNSVWEWLESKVYLREREPDILFVGRQEFLEKDFHDLKRLLGVPKEARLPENDIDMHRNPVDCDKYLSETAIRHLKRWYKADYECIKLFGEAERGLRLRT